MKRRLLSMLLVFVMVLGILPVQVLASEPGSGDVVYLSVSLDGRYIDDQNGVPMAYVPVSFDSIAAVSLEAYGLDEYQYDSDGDGIYEITALHLVIYAHEQLHGGSWSNVTFTGSPGSSYFAGGIFGFSENLNYYLNGTYPHTDGWGTTSDQIVLEAGDYLDIASFSSYSFYSDPNYGFHFFADAEGNFTHDYSAVVGEAARVKLVRSYSGMGAEPAVYEEADYMVGYGVELYGAESSTVTTDAGGEAMITFSEAGTYYLWADGGYGMEPDMMTGEPAVVSSPAYAKVTVTAPACAHEWTDATCKTPRTCSKCGAVEGTADLAAHNYVDGACAYCGEADPNARPATYTVTLPTETTGYTVSASEGSASPVTEDGSYSFSVTIAEGYEAGENFAVKTNGTVLAAVDGVYTIENITANQTVTVEGVVEKPEEPTLTWQEVMAKTQSYLTGQAAESAPVVASTNGEWVILGLARKGVDIDSDYFETYYENVEKYVAANINAANGRLHAQKSTDNSRVILALSALGKDVTNVGGYNLLQGLTDTGYVPNQGINGAVFALIALDSGNYEIPANADSSKQVSREWLINYILSKQLEGGGWSQDNRTPDDMTPMAIQALAPYYSTNADVRTAVDKALIVMETMSATTETYAQMIVALSALDIDCESDEHFADVMDKMLTFALEDGSFKKGKGSGANQMSTEQAFYAMVAYDRFQKNQTSLYDMTDVITKEQKYDITVSTNNGTVTPSKTSAAAGETITITVTPNQGYKLKSLTMNGTALTASESGAYSFTMPEQAVTLTAVFELDPAAVVTSINTLTVTTADAATQQKIAEIQAAYAALSDADKAAVTNYAAFQNMVAAFNSLLESAKVVAKAELNAYVGALKQTDYTTENWLKIQQCLAVAIANVTAAANTDAINSVVYTAKVNISGVAKGKDMTVTFRLIGDFQHNNGVTDHEEYVTWIPTTVYKMKAGATMYDVFMQAIADYGLSQRGASNNYVESIAAPSVLGGYWLGEFDNGVNSGWMYTVNGIHPGTGLKTYDLKDGDVIVWHYVDDYVQEERTSSSRYYFRWLEASDITPAAYVNQKLGKILTVGKNGTAAPQLTMAHLGRTVTFTFTPDRGYKVKNVIVDGVSKGSIEGYTYTNLSISSRIVVEFAKKGVVSFSDVNAWDWFYEDVVFAVENGLFEGTSDTLFAPDASMTRAMLVTVLYRLEGQPTVYGSSAFSDVRNNQWYSDAVIWATKSGIIEGYDNGLFGTNDNVTREQMAAILYRYAKYKGYDVSDSNSLTGYSDYSDISAYALKSLKWANAEGLITGRTNSTLAPKGTATRAEVAAIFHRFVENVVR